MAGRQFDALEHVTGILMDLPLCHSGLKPVIRGVHNRVGPLKSVYVYTYILYVCSINATPRAQEPPTPKLVFYFSMYATGRNAAASSNLNLRSAKRSVEIPTRRPRKCATHLQRNRSLKHVFLRQDMDVSLGGLFQGKPVCRQYGPGCVFFLEAPISQHLRRHGKP